ncbi:MAG: FKBP-type peptidyl-prolyl cis-trans isomerase [Candidatus Methanomethylophilaceae archaeon]
MIAKRGLKADRKAYDSMMTIGGALLAICLLIVAGIAIAENWEADPEVVQEAKAGSVVRVNFTGSFNNGWVFDTSEFDVANDSSFAKSFEFVLKSQASYQPLSFTIGGGTLLAGFESAVIGMQVGDSKTITLTAAEAYGEVPEANLSVHQVNQTLDATQWMSASQFQSFFGEAPVTGLTVSHPWYGWDVQVFHYDSVGDNVTVIHLPTQGERYAAFGDPSSTQPYGWYLEVSSVNASTIQFQHLVDVSMVNTVRGTDADGLFYLHAVDGDSFTVKHAGEKIGRPLTFTITLVEIVSV